MLFIWLELLNKSTKMIGGNGSCLCILLSVIVLLIVILVPMSIGYVDYYEYGLKQKRTGAVDTSQVYGRGRYFVGPLYGFLTYKADAHIEELKRIAVFSAGVTNSSVGLSFLIDFDFTYILNKDGIGWLHEELATSYRHVIRESAKVAIKNEAIYITFVEYFQNRTSVEARFRDAVERRWREGSNSEESESNIDVEGTSNGNLALPCTLDQFHLGLVQIPESVAERQLTSRIQNEKNDREKFLQEAQVERSKTSVIVNQISLEETTINRTAEAEAMLLKSKAQAQAQQIRVEAQTNGTKSLVDTVGIVTQEQRMAFHYIRTLRQRNKKLTLDITNLTPENIVATRAV